LSLALGAEAGFVARSVDIFQPHLKATLKRVAAHRGAAFIEILQNCNIFNDGAWLHLSDKEVRAESTITLEHGQPLVFGKERGKGIRLNGRELEVVRLGAGITEQELLVHDEKSPDPAYAFLLSRMERREGFPTPIGVLRAVEAPRYEDAVAQMVRRAIEQKGAGDLDALLRAGDTWQVE
jgi:2-oxoglutarate ferredoxin oxidoreductase subunit beta